MLYDLATFEPRRGPMNVSRIQNLGCFCAEDRPVESGTSGFLGMLILENLNGRRNLSGP